MHAVELSLRGVLAAVFLVACIGKVLDLAGARAALEGFGVPDRVARLGAPALPAAELLVAIALVLRPTAIIGAVGALVLLLIFIAGIARAMSAGLAPDCHCFGQIHSEPAGPSTLIRNGVLAAFAVVVLIAGSGPSFTHALAHLAAAQVALVVVSIVAAALAVAVAQLFADRRRLTRELAKASARTAPAGLPRGTPAPEFALTAVAGGQGDLATLRTAGHPAILVFLSTTCGPCLALLPELARWQESLDALSLVAVFSGDSAKVAEVCEADALRVAITEEDNLTFRTYALRATPSAVLIDADGLIASAPAEGAPAIEALIRTTISRLTGPLLDVVSVR